MKKRLHSLYHAVTRRSPRSTSSADPKITLTPIQARQGFLGKPVLLVLVTSIVLTVALFTLVLVIGK